MKVEADLGTWLASPGKEQGDYLAALVRAGIMSTNEARNAVGLADTAGRDVYRVPVNSTALSNLPLIGKPSGGALRSIARQREPREARTRAATHNPASPKA